MRAAYAAFVVVTVVSAAFVGATVVGASGCGLINAFSTAPPEPGADDSCVDVSNGPCRCEADGADVACTDDGGGCGCTTDGKASCDGAGVGCVVNGDDACSTASCRCEDSDGDGSCTCDATVCHGVAGDDRSESVNGGSCRGNCACDDSGCNCDGFDCFANVDGEFCNDNDDDCSRTAARFNLADTECDADADCGAGTLICVEARDGENHCLRRQPCEDSDDIDSVAHIEEGVPGADVNVCVPRDARDYRCIDNACVYGRR